MALPLVRVGQTLQQAQDNVNQNQTPNQGLRLFRVGEDNKTFLEYARWAAEQRKRQEEERLRQEEERKRLANIPAYTSRSGQNLSQNQLNNQFYTQPKNFQELAHTGRDTSPQVSNEPGLLGQMKNGFLQGAANAEKNFFTTMTKISEKLTPNSKIPQLMKNAEKGYQEILDEHPEWDAPEGTKWNSITGIARAVTGTVPFMLMSATSEVVGNLLLPGAGASAALSVTYTTEYGAAYNEAIALGATEEQAKKAAQGTGIINGIIEALPLEMITLGLWELPEKFVFKKVRSAAAKYAASASKKILTTAATEGAEEALQEFTSNYFAKKHYDEDRKLTDGVIEAYVLGAITGGILAGGTHTIEVLTSKRGEFIQQAKKEGISEEKAAAYFDEMIDDINQQQKQKSQEQQEQQEQRQEQPTEQPKTFEDTQPLQEPQPFQTIQEQEIEQQSTQTAQQQQKAEIEPIKQETPTNETKSKQNDAERLKYLRNRLSTLRFKSNLVTTKEAITNLEKETALVQEEISSIEARTKPTVAKEEALGIMLVDDEGNQYLPIKENGETSSGTTSYTVIDKNGNITVRDTKNLNYSIDPNGLKVIRDYDSSGKTIEERKKDFLAHKKETKTKPISEMTAKEAKEAGKTFVDPKNFNTAEEYVKAHGTPVYHGGTANIKDIDLNKSNFQKTFYVSENPEYAKSFGGNKSSLNKMVLDSNAKMADLRNPNNELIKQIKDIISPKETGKILKIKKPDGTFINIPEKTGGKVNIVFNTEKIIQGIKDGKAYIAELPEVKQALKELGYDGMITQESKMGANYGIWNKDILKTKSQLIAEWNEANKPEVNQDQEADPFETPAYMRKGKIDDGNRNENSGAPIKEGDGTKETKQEVKKPTKKLFTTKAEIKELKQRISEIKETKELRVKEKNAISKGLEKIDVKEGVSLHLWKTEGKVINYEIKTAKVEAQRAIKFIEKNPKKALEITLGMKDNTTGIDSTMLSSVMIKTLKNAGEHSLAQDVATKQSLNITRSAQNVSFAQNDFRPQEAPLIASIEKAKFEEFARKEGIKNKKKAREIVEDIVKEKAETLSKEVNKEAMNQETNMKALDDWLQTILC